MPRIGKVMSIDIASQSGTIRDPKGKDYFFSAVECQNETLPELYSTVQFEKDEDYKTTLVAVAVVVDQLPRRI